MTREFILDTLLPYKQDPSTCAIDGLSCLYLTPDGRKCAVGKHLKEGEWQNKGGHAIDLFNTWGEEAVLTEEALAQNIPLEIWILIQRCHDALAHKDLVSYNDDVCMLEEATGFKFPELLIESITNKRN